jgi:hypothetical protein
VIIRPPEPMLLTGNGDHDLVEMPDVTTARRLAPEAAGVSRSKLQRPAADRFIGDDNTTLEQHLLDQPQAQGKPEIEPDCMSDDLGRKAVAFVADRLDHADRSTRRALTLELT